jgi:hypothetical protein
MMRLEPQQYGQQAVSDTTFVPGTGNTRRDFLNRKYEDDLRNAKIWRRFTLVASALGLALVFLGVAGGIVTGLIAGALVGGIVGGISTVSGLVTNIFLHLVYNPAEKANERLEHTCMLIMEEERREAQRKEDLQLLERLDEADIKEYIKQRLFKHIPSAELPPAEGISGKVEKRSRSQKPL